MDFYYFSLCHVCKKSTPDLKKCSSCKILHYCSRDHQVLDWSKHKRICKAITNTNTIMCIAPGASAADFNHFKYSAAILWRTELGRSLDIFEQHMWMFPKVCSVCYSFDANIVCQNCLTVAYCSEEHQNSHRDSHDKFCAQLKLCITVHQITFREQISTDWIKFNMNKDVQQLPENTEGVLNCMGFPKQPEFSKKHIDYLVMAEFYCPVINMVYALEKSGFVNNRQAKKSKINIHIVGSDLAEYKMSWALALEFLSHWITNLQSANIFLIGPEVQAVNFLSLTFNCEECRVKHYKGTVTGIKAFYHDAIYFISRPDLVVAFNSGLHEFANSELDNWRASIPKLIRYKDIPLLLTAYTETELKRDVARFPASHIKYFVKPQCNPYSNLRPIRNWEEGSVPVFYQNNYFTIFSKK